MKFTFIQALWALLWWNLLLVAVVIALGALKAPSIVTVVLILVVGGFCVFRAWRVGLRRP